MSNILWETVFIIVGLIICLRLLNKAELKNERFTLTLDAATTHFEIFDNKILGGTLQTK